MLRSPLPGSAPPPHPSADPMFLGIDIGTSGFKAVVTDEDAAVMGQGTAPPTVRRARPLWSEQGLDAWWQATCAAVGAIDPASRRAVRGIGLAGQIHGATVLRADDAPLRAAILWNGGRSVARSAALETALPELHAITGNIAMRVSPRPNCCGCAIMSPTSSRRSRPCYCRRIMFGCA